MAVVHGQCPRCAIAIAFSVGQTVQNGRIEWFRSYHCPACNLQIEEDGIDETPPEIREAILNVEEKWAIEVDSIDHQKAAAMKVIRELLKLSLTEISVLRKQIPGKLVEGTQLEMGRIETLLRSAGISCRALPMFK
jgi:hypothetical protein